MICGYAGWIVDGRWADGCCLLYLLRVFVDHDTSFSFSALSLPIVCSSSFQTMFRQPHGLTISHSRCLGTSPSWIIDGPACRLLGLSSCLQDHSRLKVDSNSDRSIHTRTARFTMACTSPRTHCADMADAAERLPGDRLELNSVRVYIDSVR